ncbi:hypothetical protein [Brevibacillus laterosporus]|uniref:hypothetical protein n=1 Tax=Brevibacillus laterosporus TaxID=1465 RepID=UPI0018F88F54|nr:hypothetical protein [Brevibacillus laterosporus]MBG9776163.1 hypothetical protein [Brevibacillus laterosporus]
MLLRDSSTYGRTLQIGLEIKKYRKYSQIMEAHLKAQFDELNAISVTIPEEEQNIFLDYHVEDYYHLSKDFPSILRYSVFIQVYSFLEFTLKSYCSLAKKSLEIKLSDRDLSGSGIERYRTYLKKVVEMPFPDSIPEWALIQKYNIIRNCIAHTQGNLEEMNNSNKIKETISNLNNIELDGNSTVILKESFCDDVINTIDKFLIKFEGKFAKHIHKA